MADETAITALIAQARAFLGLTMKDAQEALGAEAHEVRLVTVNRDGLRGGTKAGLCSQIEGDPVRLRSRASKRAQLLIYASQGIAFSSQGEELDFLEAFAPCTQDEYEARYYRPPNLFIR